MSSDPFDALLYETSGIMPLLVMAIGIIYAVVSMLGLTDSKQRRYLIGIGIVLIIAGLLIRPITQYTLWIDTIIVFVCSAVIFFALRKLVLLWKLEAEPAKAQQKIDKTIEEHISKQLDPEHLSEKIGNVLNNLQIDSAQGKMVLDFIEMRSQNTAAEAINKRINGFTASMTVVGGALGAFAIFSFFNLSEIKDDASKILSDIEDRSQRLEDKVGALENDVEEFQKIIETERDEIISVLVDQAQEKWSTSINANIQSAIATEITAKSADIVEGLKGKAAEAVTLKDDIDDLRQEITDLKASVTDADLRARTYQIQETPAVEMPIDETKEEVLE